MDKKLKLLKQMENKIDNATKIFNDLVDDCVILIWNEAMETAALTAEKYESYQVAYELRTLKK